MVLLLHHFIGATEPTIRSGALICVNSPRGGHSAAAIVETRGRVESRVRAPQRRFGESARGYSSRFNMSGSLSSRFNLSGSLAMFDATRLASSIVICFASMASSSVERP
jgi:hypothetical protein